MIILIENNHKKATINFKLANKKCLDLENPAKKYHLCQLQNKATQI